MTRQWVLYPVPYDSWVFPFIGGNRQYCWFAVSTSTFISSSFQWFFSFGWFPFMYALISTQLFPKFSLCADIPFYLSPWAFISVTFSSGTLQGPSPPFMAACRLPQGSKPDSYNISFVSHLSEITVLHCLISSVSQTVASYFFSSLFGCFRWQDLLGSCYSIWIETEVKNIDL